MNTFPVAIVILAATALCMGLSRMLLTGTESRAKRIAINGLCLALGAVLAVGGLKYVVPALTGDSSLSKQSGLPTQDNGGVSEDEIQSKVEKAWKENRFFALLEEADPATAQQIRAQLAGLARHALESGGEFQVNDLAAIGDAAAKVAMPLINRASDQAVSDFADVALQQMNTLRDQNPKYCLLFLFPQAFAGEQLPPNIAGLGNNRILPVLAEILDSAMHTPQAPPSRERANTAIRATLDSLLPELEARHGGREPVVAAFAAMSDPRLLSASNHAIVADVAISFYERIMQLPIAERSQALRLLFAGATE